MSTAYPRGKLWPWSATQAGASNVATPFITAGVPALFSVAVPVKKLSGVAFVLERLSVAPAALRPPHWARQR